jgi:hydroxyacylglutathione hydrolase
MTEIKTKKYQNFEINMIPALRDNYIYLLKCFKTNKIICIDPGEFKAADDFLQNRNLNLDYIITTHHHWDHVSGIAELKAKYGCKVIAFSEDRTEIPQIDIEIALNSGLKSQNPATQIVSRETIAQNNEIINEFETKHQNVSRETITIRDDFKLGEITFRPFATFGHCANHISYFIPIENILFCGDTLFSSGCGRVFLGGGIEELFESLNKIKNLPKDTDIYCAHEYTLDNLQFALSLEPKNQDLFEKKALSQKLRAQNQPTLPTKLENELKTNPFLRSNVAELRNSLNIDRSELDLEVFRATRNAKNVFKL